ncbi:fibrobacter succinogenes major paralogous domain-containing protein [uncultured Fibrobacter sp.]|uniref:fibrobacter succinogenes major paralogous domain-containing protein n=1 Tax=uncultured Fibrobacter sp. TaxID=261512 RepID=UPI002805FD44|nr:fibrobacter succinogenes major paralogous domain-containing protein [uncultured Fibrobacter sp.]
MHIKRYLFTAFALFTLVGLASAEQVCTESEYKGRTIKKCRDTGAPGGGSSTDSFTDPRDGQSYRTVKIGDQIWMAENLNYKTDDSYCYDDEPANCRKYGRLYTWLAAMYACPEGWHLPSEMELNTLFESVGGTDIAGTKLRSTSGWNDDEGKSGNGTDEFGFSALPAGIRGNDGDFNDAGYIALFWSASEYRSDIAYYMSLDYNDDGAFLDSYGKDFGFSVRCLRDSIL